MNTIDLKNNFHRLIDKIDNDRILTKFYSLLQRASTNSEGQLWERLSEDEKQELLQIDSEIESEDNLIPHSEIREKHKKWL